MIDFKEKLDEHIEQENSKHQKEEDPSVFHPSAIGYCKRQAYIRKVGIVDYPEKVYRIFHIGKIIHKELEKLQDLIDEGAKFEQNIELKKEGIVFKGRYDCFDGETVYDFKTTKNLYYIKKNGAKKRHKTQLNIYMEAVGAEKGQLVFIQKHDLEVYTVEVEKNPSLIQEAVDKAQLIKSKIQELDNPKQTIPFSKCGCFNCRKEKLNDEYL